MVAQHGENTQTVNYARLPSIMPFPSINRTFWLAIQGWHGTCLLAPLTFVVSLLRASHKIVQMNFRMSRANPRYVGITLHQAVRKVVSQRDDPMAQQSPEKKSELQMGGYPHEAAGKSATTIHYNSLQ